MNIPTQNKRKTAIHEAGHFVATIRLGHVGGDVTIKRDFESGTNGHSQFEEISDYNQSLAQEEVLISCAGYAALAAFGYTEVDCKSGAERDFEEAEELIENFALEPLSIWLSRTVDLMSTSENKKAVGRIVDELLESEFIDRDIAQVLIEVADGDSSELDLVIYRRNKALTVQS